MNASEVQRRADGDQAPRQVGKGAVEGAWFFREARRGVGGPLERLRVFLRPGGRNTDEAARLRG